MRVRFLRSRVSASTYIAPFTCMFVYLGRRYLARRCPSAVYLLFDVLWGWGFSPHQQLRAPGTAAAAVSTSRRGCKGCEPSPLSSLTLVGLLAGRLGSKKNEGKEEW